MLFFVYMCVPILLGALFLGCVNGKRLTQELRGRHIDNEQYRRMMSCEDIFL
mgnify:CR=1 FL=1